MIVHEKDLFEKAGNREKEILKNTVTINVLLYEYSTAGPCLEFVTAADETGRADSCIWSTLRREYIG